MSGNVITPLDRLKRLHARLVANPHQHDQGTWYEKSEVCGTTACAAGWAVVDAATDDPRIEIGFNTSAWSEDVEIISAVRLEPDGLYQTMYSAGRILLGLSEEEADRLFYGSGKDEAVEYIAELIEDREAAA